MLSGVNVLEIVGLCSVSMCSYMLKDYGACVTRIFNSAAKSVCETDLIQYNSKASIDLKNKHGIEELFHLCSISDVLLDPYRPGLLAHLGFSLEKLHKINPRLILAQISGYGQIKNWEDEEYFLRPGHDINYLAETGILWLFVGRKDKLPTPPPNLIAEIGGGALTAAFGIVLALLEREKTNKGKIVDVSIADGLAYMSSQFMISRQLALDKMIPASMRSFMWPELGSHCANLLDGGAPFYRAYATKDNKHIAVGAIEPQQYENLLKGLDLKLAANRMDHEDWPRISAILSGIFGSHTREHWMRQRGLVNSACLSPVWSPEEAVQHRPSEVFRHLDIPLSPLLGAGSALSLGIKVPTPCPKIYSFPGSH